MKTLGVSLVGALALAGCATVPKTAGYADVAQRVAERTGQQTHWDQGAPEDAEVDRRPAPVRRR